MRQFLSAAHSSKRRSVTRSQLPQKYLIGLIIPAAVVAVALGLYISMGKQEPQKAARADQTAAAKLQTLPIVELAYVREYDAQRSLDLKTTGLVVPLREVSLAAEVAGRIVYKSEKCRAGNYVQKGEVLFRIDDTDYRLAVERLATQRQSEYSQQRELEQEIANTQRLLEVAQQELELQDREIKRLESLGQGFASVAELDAASRQRLSSLNQITTVQNQIDLLRTRRTRVELAEKLAAAQLKQAEIDLERATIRAPLEGIIVNENVQADSFVQRGAVLCVMEDVSAAEVSSPLRADQLATILNQNISVEKLERDAELATNYQLPRTPATVVYRLAGREDLRFEWDGYLDRYEGVGIDVQSRTIAVRIKVDDPRQVRLVRGGQSATQPLPPATTQSDAGVAVERGMVQALLRGMFVEVVLHTRPSESMVLVPKLAVRPGGNIWRFVPDDTVLNSEAASNAKVELRPVADADERRAWTIGKIEIVDSAQTVQLIEDQNSSELNRGNDYWVVISNGRLPAGSPVVITPLAAILGNGEDYVRAPVSTTAPVNARD